MNTYPWSHLSRFPLHRHIQGGDKYQAWLYLLDHPRHIYFPQLSCVKEQEVRSRNHLLWASPQQLFSPKSSFIFNLSWSRSDDFTMHASTRWVSSRFSQVSSVVLCKTIKVRLQKVLILSSGLMPLDKSSSPSMMTRSGQPSLRMLMASFSFWASNTLYLCSLNSWSYNILKFFL